MSLRVRRVGRRIVQTVKAIDGVNSGLFDRGEWEHPIGRTQQPDFAAMHDTPLAPLLDGRGPEALRPIFESRVRRTVYCFDSDGSQLAVNLDQGEVDTGQAKSPVCELEFELLHGDAAALFSTARALAQEVPLQDCGAEQVRPRLRPREQRAASDGDGRRGRSAAGNDAAPTPSG